MKTMKEIKIFLNKDKTNEVIDQIKFKEIMAGQTSIGELYIQNMLNYGMDVALEIKGKHVNISETIKQLPAFETKKVELKISPPLTIMKPITAELKIKLDYVVS